MTDGQREALRKLANGAYWLPKGIAYALTASGYATIRPLDYSIDRRLTYITDLGREELARMDAARTAGKGRL